MSTRVDFPRPFPLTSDAATRETGKPFMDSDRIIFGRIADFLDLDGVWAWGSRTRGWWIDTSDYDVLVPLGNVPVMRERAAQAAAALGVKVDLFFGAPAWSDAVWVERIPSITMPESN